MPGGNIYETYIQPDIKSNSRYVTYEENVGRYHAASKRRRRRK
jgi:hypothetical protein